MNLDPEQIVGNRDSSYVSKSHLLQHINYGDYSIQENLISSSDSVK